MGTRQGHLSRRQLLSSAALAPASALLTDCRVGTPPAEALTSTREVTALIDAQPTIEGAGVHLRRSLGSSALPGLDPFLLLDEFHSSDPADYAAGFPSHPHRGFETVTYMLEGAMEHRDSLGNHGHLGPGSAQWMTAGHGIIHSEMPKQEQGLMWGFQLWVNLPAAQKLTRPRYQDLPPERITEVTADGARVRLVAGELGGERGPVDGIVTAPTMLDVELAAHEQFTHAIPAAHNAFVYVVQGAAEIGSARRPVHAGQLAALGPGGLAAVRTTDGARFLLVAAMPIGEPVARYGPFVMNTDEEIRQAITDYRAGRLTES
jgi:redox-sensitive bicupin YhaK (pirin superfamily)